MDILQLIHLPDFVVRYLQDLEAKGRQPSTIKRYKYDIDDFFRWWKKKHEKEISFDDWREISREDYKEFFGELITKRNYSPRTYKRIATVLTRFCIYYESLGFSVTMPGIDLSRNKIRKLTKEDFVLSEDLDKLIHSIPSMDGLSDIQLASRPFLINRNLSIVFLFSKYGLTLQELVGIRMKDINFVQKTIKVSSITSVSREIELEREDSLLLFAYYKDIPEPVRPKQFTGDPFFIAFDFWRGTYHWVYEDNKPKRLTEVSIQKMLRQETNRAGLNRGITPQHMRNTAILESLRSGLSKESIQKLYGFRSNLSADRYTMYLKSIDIVMNVEK